MRPCNIIGHSEARAIASTVLYNDDIGVNGYVAA